MYYIRSYNERIFNLYTLFLNSHVLDFENGKRRAYYRVTEQDSESPLVFQFQVLSRFLVKCKIIFLASEACSIFLMSEYWLKSY